jgi:hypothetical protein
MLRNKTAIISYIEATFLLIEGVHDCVREFATIVFVRAYRASENNGGARL